MWQVGIGCVGREQRFVAAQYPFGKRTRQREPPADEPPVPIAVLLEPLPAVAPPTPSVEEVPLLDPFPAEEAPVPKAALAWPLLALAAPAPNVELVPPLPDEEPPVPMAVLAPPLPDVEAPEPTVEEL